MPWATNWTGTTDSSDTSSAYMYMLYTMCAPYIYIHIPTPYIHQDAVHSVFAFIRHIMFIYICIHFLLIYTFLIFLHIYSHVYTLHTYTIYAYRYDHISESMEHVRQDYQTKLDSKDHEYTRIIKQNKDSYELTIKKLNIEINRLKSDRQSDTYIYQESLDKQVKEGENRVKGLIKVYESELATEKELVVKLRNIIQT